MLGSRFTEEARELGELLDGWMTLLWNPLPFVPIINKLPLPPLQRAAKYRNDVHTLIGKIIDQYKSNKYSQSDQADTYKGLIHLTLDANENRTLSDDEVRYVIRYCVCGCD